MKKTITITVSLLGLILISGLLYFRIAIFPQFPVANGYAAKKMCSCTFIAERTQESIQSEDLGFEPISLTKTTINHQQKSATSSLFGLSARTAVYREGAGCILLDGKDDYNIRIPLSPIDQSELFEWPNASGSWLSEHNIDQTKLGDAVSKYFDVDRNMDSLKTRAVVIIYKDTLIHESYANGFHTSTPILGWSMTKSITGTLIGVLVKKGDLNLDDTDLFPEWMDERKGISLKDLLQMQSGLAFKEEYTSLSDATKMLYMSENVSDIPIQQNLSHPIGSRWSYSSGTTNILSALIANTINNQEKYHLFPYESLFNKIGMSSAIIETDESGHFIGSSYMYATPRDWAKFGSLYLHSGNWFGKQIIDSSWVDFVKTPAKHSEGIYGGQFWLNANHSAYPDVPEDLYSCNGYQGQYVFIIPSRDLVVVRMGLAESPIFDVNGFLRDILANLPVS